MAGYHLQESLSMIRDSNLDGRALPRRLYDEGGFLVLPGIRMRKRFCLMACFKLAPKM